MDFRHLKRIIKEFESSSISKLEITEKDFNIKLEKANNNISPATVDNLDINDNNLSNQKNDLRTNFFVLESPLVGTFYEAASPDSSPFVTLNQRVEKGEVLFIIEAMKVMNEIKSPISGIVRNISVSNGQTVEYAQKIMEIEESNVS
jgi:acetyl-CoA carboxylase biotin carboxyl carrier protein